MRRILPLTLALLLLLAAALPLHAFAEEPDGEEAPIVLDSREAFLAFAEACCEESYSLGRVFELACDVDLAGTGFEPIAYFAGTLKGNGHTISGLSVTGAGSRMGLFRRTGPTSAIHDLNAEGVVDPAGTQEGVGGLVGEHAGSLVSCSFSGEVSGIADVGGVVGRNTATGRVSGCSFRGSVTGEHQVGGIAGKNEGVLADCLNSGSVNTVPVTPAGEFHFDLSAVSQNDFLNISNIGGIVGENPGVTMSCINSGSVGYHYDGYNVGGIAGKCEGFLQDCENTGAVTGRRDVGGICGQLVPFSQWDLSKGKLDELEGSLLTLQGLLDNTARDAAALGDSMADEIARMQVQSDAAYAALENLMEGMDGQSVPDGDNVHYNPETGEIVIDGSRLYQADMTEMNEALSNLRAESAAMMAESGGAAGVVGEDLAAVSRQMGDVFNKLSGAADNVGNVRSETVDLSADETYEHDIAAIDGCVNKGPVNAENHAGGVVGTVGFELDFDMEDRLDLSRFLVSDSKHILFAAVRACESYGAAAAKEEGAGCIAGAADIGCIADCIGLGEARCQNGDCAGGIVGRSKGTVRGCWSRAALSGRRYVGGTAGLGTDLIGCRSWAHIESAEEYRGAVAGWAEGTVSDNLYVPDAPAGVDGVSFVGQSRAVSAQELLREEGVPQDFDHITLRFMVGDEVVRTLELPFGGSLDELPEVPNREECYWKWDDFDREHLYYSRSIEGKYYAPNSTLSSGGEVPQFLVEGVFYEGQSLTVLERQTTVEGQKVLGAWTLTVGEYDGTLTVRLYAPETGRVYRIADSTAELLDTSRDGRYLVFTLENGGTLAYTRAEEPHSAYRIAPIGAGVAGAAVIVLLLRRRKRKQSAPPEAESGD